MRTRPGITIIGSGFAGIGMAIKLKEAGYHDFVILEKAADLGGTWRDNTYPGCACDVPSHMYSFSYELNPGWSRMFSPQTEIWDYMRDCVVKYGLTPTSGSARRSSGWSTTTRPTAGRSAPPTVRRSPPTRSSPASGRCTYRRSRRSPAVSASGARPSTRRSGTTPWT
nr:hypothetical protein GCM10020093_095290 [Planobispora longispora]